MWLVLYPILDKLTSHVVVGLSYLGPARKVSEKVLPLHVGIAESYEDRRHVSKQEVSLSMEVVTLVPPKGMCSS